MKEDFKELLKMIFHGIDALVILGAIISLICWMAG